MHHARIGQPFYCYKNNLAPLPQAVCTTKQLGRGYNGNGIYQMSLLHTLPPLSIVDCPLSIARCGDTNEDATRKRQRRLMVQKEQAERSRQRLEQKVKENELRQQLAAKKDRQESINLLPASHCQRSTARTPLSFILALGGRRVVHPSIDSVIISPLTTASKSTPC